MFIKKACVINKYMYLYQICLCKLEDENLPLRVVYSGLFVYAQSYLFVSDRLHHLYIVCWKELDVGSDPTFDKYNVGTRVIFIL